MKKFALLLLVMGILFAGCNQPKSTTKEEPAKPLNMKYRLLGNTGLQVSEIGIGCGCFGKNDTAFAKKYVDVALDSGVNYIDLYTADPLVRDEIGYALKGRRDKMIIQGHVGTIWQDGQNKCTNDLEEMKMGFQDLLTRLHTDYIDVGMIHYIDSKQDWEEVKEGNLMKYMLELKETGKIKHIGFACHNPLVALDAVESGLIEVLMFSINPAFDLLPPEGDIFDSKSFEESLLNIDSTRSKLYETCYQNGVGIVTMKVFGGGKLLSDETSPLGKALTPCQCIQYALTRPAVATVLTGADSIDELLESLHYNTATPQEKDYASVFLQITKVNWKGDCIYCTHCSPCPVGIDVAAVTRLLNIAQLQGNKPSEAVMKEYKALKHKAGECTQCGGCESRCPFSVPIRDNMLEAQRIFGE